MGRRGYPPEFRRKVLDLVEAGHNRRRRHSALGWQSPLEFENQNKIVVA